MVQVDQAELEVLDGVSPGKYTVGLGQVSAANDTHNLVGQVEFYNTNQTIACYTSSPFFLQTPSSNCTTA